MTTIQYQYFPKNQLLPEILRQVVDIFIAQEHLISSQTHLLHSNDVLHILSEPLMALGFKVEVSKRLEDKIRIPVLFGRNGEMENTLRPIVIIRSITSSWKLKPDEPLSITNFERHLSSMCNA